MSLRRKCQELGSSCCVPSCSRLDRDPSFTSYHRFPNTKIRTKWITAIQNVTKNISWKPEPEGEICSRHFLASDVLRREEDDVKETVLRSTAFPSVNLLPVAKDELGDNHDDDDAVEIKMEDDIDLDQTAFDPFEVANQFFQQDGDDDSDQFCITPSPQLNRRRAQAQNRTLRKQKRYDSSPPPPAENKSKSRTRSSKAVSRTSCRRVSKTMHRPKILADRDPPSKADLKTRSGSVRKRVKPSQKPVLLPPRQDDEIGHDDTPRKLNICPTCGKLYTTKSQLSRHIRRHTGEKPAKCDHCEEAFFDKPTLDRHVALVHTKTGHICHVCGNSFRLLKGLTNHLRRHDESRRHVCETCGQKFVDRNKLRSHQVREHGADPWVCDQCGATFTTVGGLRIHVMAHTGEKPYKCETCKYSSLSKESLAKHKRTHTGERPFHCPHCESAFVASCDLKRHIKRIHTPDYVAPLLHSCPECGKGFKRRYVLDAHIRRGHKGPSPATSPGVEK